MTEELEPLNRLEAIDCYMLYAETGENRYKDITDSGARIQARNMIEQLQRQNEKSAQNRENGLKRRRSGDFAERNRATVSETEKNQDSLTFAERNRANDENTNTNTYTITDTDTPTDTESSAEAAEEKLFEMFWEAYPKKTYRSEAEKVFAELAPDDRLTNRIIDSLGAWMASEDWTKEDGKYIPNPANFLSKRRFEESPKKVGGHFCAPDEGWMEILNNEQ